MKSRAIKDLLYEQVARVGRALSSPKRLELLEILCQGEKSVERLAGDADISVKLASAHLKTLRMARLVDARREGKRMFYRLTDRGVAELWVVLRDVAHQRLTALQTAMRELVASADALARLDGKQLLARAASGDVVVLDVRPGDEYETAHLPYARSLPVNELRRRVNEVPSDKPIVAYCRGPFCLMAKEAVEVLRAQGRDASLLEDGVAEWRAKGLPLEAA